MSPIGIRRIASLDYYVHDPARARRFLVEKLDFQETSASTPALGSGGEERGVVLRAGECAIHLVSPESAGSAAGRFLSRHPEGVGVVTFEVEDAERALALIEERGGTPITEVARLRDEGGTMASFSVATPIGDTDFRFVEHRGFAAPFPGFEAAPARANRFGILAIDHVTANFRTLSPAVLWMEHVLGFQRSWEVRFHTSDMAAPERGSGLASQVMCDPGSGVKLACNEPLRPHFGGSQIALFTEDHRGDGIQHAALVTRDIVSAVRGLRAAGVPFRPTPAAYYDALGARMSRSGVGPIAERLEELRELGVLVDGSAEGRYLLQIFLEEPARMYGDPEAGPFFFELIQRRGDEGFGAGNFRALFESIEREQRRRG